MSQSSPTQLRPIPDEGNITIVIREMNAADKKDAVAFHLKSSIQAEYRKYTKVKRLKSIDPGFIHERDVTFILDHPNPAFSKILGYNVHFGPEGVIVSRTSLRPDPEITPILDSVNLSQVALDFFKPRDFRPRKQIPLSLPCPETQQPCLTSETPPAGIVPTPAVKLIKPTRLPNGKPVQIPCFRFGGHYLEKFGFAIGTSVTMLVEQNKITLTVASDQNPGRLTA